MPNLMAIGLVVSDTKIIFMFFFLSMSGCMPMQNMCPTVRARHNFNNLGLGLLDVATYQISRI